MKEKNKTYSWKLLLKKMVVSSRPISWVNTAFPFAAGYIASGGVINSYFFVATFYFLIPYNFLIYIVNDIFDYESDVRNPRKNSIEGGLLPPQTHRFMAIATALINVVPLIYLFAQGSRASNLLLGLIIFAAISYSMPPLRLKEKPFLDSVNSSFHFVSPLLFAFLLTGWSASYSLYLIAFFLWGAASHAFGAVQDIIVDREAGIHSIATLLGASRTIILSTLLYVVTVIALATVGWPVAFVCVPLMGYVITTAHFIGIKDADSEKANKGWRKFLALNQLTGFVVTVLIIIDKL